MLSEVIGNLGRVLNVFPGNDNVVRVVEVKTADGSIALLEETN